MILIFRSLLGAVAVALAIAACGSNDATAGTEVVATTSILGDIAANVVGDAGSVAVLVPIGADPHDYRPSSRQMAALTSADLVIVNGLGLEEGLEESLDAAAADGARLLTVGPEVDPMPFAGGTTPDPHVWLDPVRVAAIARLIATDLEAIEPGGGWQERADAYAARLENLDAEIAATLAGVPAERRTLVTNHDSLEYFAARYGFTVVGTVIPGGSTLGNPSASDIADLVAKMEAASVRVLFAETTEPVELAEAVASELGDEVAVVELFTGSLGERGTSAETLAGLLMENARRISAALTEPNPG